MGTFHNKDGKAVLFAMVEAIRENKDYLGEVDGLIGDGDHGMNMNKGFSIFAKRYGEKDFTFTEGLKNLGNILLTQIGGSMGPIYGTIFIDMAECGDGLEEIDVQEFSAMVASGLAGLQEIVEAKVGDKTLIDTLVPASDALKAAADSGLEYRQALEEMKTAAAAGMESTRDLVAKFGRSSRLGERSRGVLDAGSVSCCILLEAMADEMAAQLA